MKEFKIRPIHEPFSDSLILYLENVPSYSKWVNENVTTFHATDDDRIVGIEISDLEGVKSKSINYGIFLGDYVL